MARERWLVWFPVYPKYGMRLLTFPSKFSVSGYTVCGLYTSIVPGETVFNPRLTQWIKTFYSIAVVQSALTTGFMAYKIWTTDRLSAQYRTSKSSLLPIVRILVESAALQLFVEVLLLALYVVDYNAQYILLEIVTPLVVSTGPIFLTFHSCPNSSSSSCCSSPFLSTLQLTLTFFLPPDQQGITFVAITIRITLRMPEVMNTSSQLGPSSNFSRGRGSEPTTTFGSIPLRPIAISMTRDVQDHRDIEKGTSSIHTDHTRTEV